MKRVFLILLTVLALTAVACAESSDLASMPFEELEALKHAVDLEYNSRPESEGITLYSGVYTVGQDLLPGHYYAAMVKPDPLHSNTDLLIYDSIDIFEEDNANRSDENAKHRGYFFLSYDPQMVALEDGNVLIVEGGSLLIKRTPFDPQEYYQYQPPEGTVIAAGKYTVGSEIPAGTYHIYPATADGAVYKHTFKKTREDGSIEETSITDQIYIMVETPFKQLTLAEGDVLEVSRSIVMVKPQTLKIE